MWEFIKEHDFIVGAVSGSLAAYLIGLWVGYLRREKRWLGFSISSRNVVRAGPEKLRLAYDGKTIQRLDSHTVLLRNIGNKPLGPLPVRVRCESGLILENELEAPDGAKFDVSIEKESIVILVDLLNPGEAFTVGLTVVDSADTGGVSVSARAEYLELREIDERAKSLELIEALMPHLFLGNIIVEMVRFTNSRRR